MATNTCSRLQLVTKQKLYICKVSAKLVKLKTRKMVQKEQHYQARRMKSLGVSPDKHNFDQF